MTAIRVATKQSLTINEVVWLLGALDSVILVNVTFPGSCMLTKLEFYGSVAVSISDYVIAFF
jgi:hypothetical protein